jgi:hypothetical protein
MKWIFLKNETIHIGTEQMEPLMISVISVMWQRGRKRKALNAIKNVK